MDIRIGHQSTQENIQLIAAEAASLGLGNHQTLIDTIYRRSQELMEAILDSFAAYPL